MKKLLFAFMLTLFVLGADGQMKDTTVTIGGSLYPLEMRKLFDTTFNRTILNDVFAPTSNLNIVHGRKNEAHWQFRDGSKTLLYSIKADGTIELGDLLIDAVIKGLEKKGYYLIKVGSSTTADKKH